MLAALLAIAVAVTVAARLASAEPSAETLAVTEGLLAPDNTGVNTRDREGKTLTPQDQSESEGDRELTRRIRQAVMDDGSLSFEAKNAKIITVNGRVTLRGPVKNAEEKLAIEAHAAAAAGGAVDSQLEIETV
jgi:osmotically-inducible protein OsmY